MPQPQLPDHIWMKSINLFKEWYDEIDTFHGRNLLMHYESLQEHRNAKKHLLKLKPEYRDRMIKAGYSLDPSNQKTMGMLYDLNRAFVGLQSPLKEEWERFKNK